MSVIEQQRDADNWLRELRAMRSFTGDPAAFWPKLLEYFGRYASGRMVLLFARDDPAGEWRRLAAWPRNRMNQSATSSDIVEATRIADQTATDEVVVQFLGAAGNGDGAQTRIDRDEARASLMGFQLNFDDAERQVSMVFFVEGLTDDEAHLLAERLQLLMDIPV
ncbi:MAG: hypothetical protein AAF525_17930, partial [Pseudomonadota bacterium]